MRRGFTITTGLAVALAVAGIAPGARAAAPGPGRVLALNYAKVSAMAVDPAGDVYLADPTQSRVIEVATDGTRRVVWTGQQAPLSLAVDSSGDVFVGVRSPNHVIEVTANGAQRTLGSISGPPVALAVDPAGDLFVGTPKAPPVKISPSGVVTTVRVGLRTTALATDARGDLFATGVVTAGNGELVEVTPAGRRTVLATGFQNAASVAVNPAGDAFVADASYTPRLVEVTPQGQQTVVDANVKYPARVAIDGSGNVFIDDGGPQPAYSDPESGTPGPGPDDIDRVTPQGRTTLVASPLQPYRLAVASDGDVLATDATDGRIVSVAPDGVSSQIGYDSYSPLDVAVDAASGQVYVDDEQPSEPLELKALTPKGTRSVAGNLGYGNGGLAADSSGDEFVGVGNKVLKIAPGGAVSTAVGDVPDVTGLALDPAGDLLVSDYENNRVLRVAPDGTETTVADVQQPTALATDAAGDTFVARTGQPPIEILPDGSIQAIPGAPVTSSVAADSAGDLFLVNGIDIEDFPASIG